MSGIAAAARAVSGSISGRSKKGTSAEEEAEIPVTVNRRLITDVSSIVLGHCRTGERGQEKWKKKQRGMVCKSLRRKSIAYGTGGKKGRVERAPIGGWKWLGCWRNSPRTSEVKLKKKGILQVGSRGGGEG